MIVISGAQGQESTPRRDNEHAKTSHVASPLVGGRITEVLSGACGILGADPRSKRRWWTSGFVSMEERVHQVDAFNANEDVRGSLDESCNIQLVLRAQCTRHKVRLFSAIASERTHNASCSLHAIAGTSSSAIPCSDLNDRADLFASKRYLPCLWLHKLPAMGPVPRTPQNIQ